MAFVITSTNMAVSKPEIAVRLILLMMGALIVGFGSFSLLIQTNKDRMKYIGLTIIIGVIVVLSATFLVT